MQTCDITYHTGTYGTVHTVVVLVIFILVVVVVQEHVTSYRQVLYDVSSTTRLVIES